MFIHDAVLETLTCGDTQIPASDLRGALNKLKKVDKALDGHGITGFKKQFEVCKTAYYNECIIYMCYL